jgi:hypothetical protein
VPQFRLDSVRAVHPAPSNGAAWQTYAAMDEHEDEPELAGYVPHDERPLHSRRRTLIFRVVVIIGVLSLILPGFVTSLSVASATANRSCAIWVHYAAPDAAGSEARFEVFGPGGIGWECYSVGAFGGDRHVVSLGLIPGEPRLPVHTLDT